MQQKVKKYLKTALHDPYSYKPDIFLFSATELSSDYEYTSSKISEYRQIVSEDSLLLDSIKSATHSCLNDESTKYELQAEMSKYTDRQLGYHLANAKLNCDSTSIRYRLQHNLDMLASYTLGLRKAIKQKNYSYRVTHRYRAKNRFGAYVIGYSKFVFVTPDFIMYIDDSNDED